MMPLIVYLTNAVMSTLRKTHEIRKTWGELYVCEYRMIPVASVLSHVDDVRDRMALLCVSRIWRDVGVDAPGRWANCQRLLFENPLARRLTARATYIFQSDRSNKIFRVRVRAQAFMQYLGTSAATTVRNVYTRRAKSDSQANA